MKDYLEEFMAEGTQKLLKYAQVTHHQNHQKPPEPDHFDGFDGSPPPHISKVAPCVVCGRRERWDHGGIWRCVACWPPEAFIPKKVRHA